MDYLSWGAKHILGDEGKGGAGGNGQGANVHLLVDRLRNSSVVGRRDLVAEIKTYAVAQQEELGRVGMPVLVQLLQRSDMRDPEVTQVVLETLIDLVTMPDNGAHAAPGSGAPGRDSAAGGDKQQQQLPPAIRNTERLLKEERGVEALLGLLEDGQMWIRLFTIQLLIALLSQRPSLTEQAVLDCPTGLSRLLGVLEDKREEVRNELLLLLLTLTRSNPLIQQFMAFQEGFERLFEIMREERFDGGVIELDCLRIVNNLLANNALTCKVFSQGACVAHLPALLELRVAHAAVRPAFTAGPEVLPLHMVQDPSSGAGGGGTGAGSGPPSSGSRGGGEQRFALNADHRECLFMGLRLVSQLVMPVPATTSLAARGMARGEIDADTRAVEDARNKAMAAEGQTHVSAARGLLAAVAWLGLAFGVADAELRAAGLRTLAAAVTRHPAAQNQVLHMSLRKLASLHTSHAAARTATGAMALRAMGCGPGATGSVLAAVITAASTCDDVTERQAAFAAIAALFDGNAAARMSFIGHAVTPPPQDMDITGPQRPPPVPPGRELIDKLLSVAASAVRLRHTAPAATATPGSSAAGAGATSTGATAEASVSRALWSACRLFELVLGDDAIAKELALRIPTSTQPPPGAKSAASGPASASLMFPRWCALLAQALQQRGTPVGVQVAMARATCVWLHDCPASAQAFLSTPSNLYLFDILGGGRRGGTIGVVAGAGGAGAGDASSTTASAPPSAHTLGVAAVLVAACLESLGAGPDDNAGGNAGSSGGAPSRQSRAGGGGSGSGSGGSAAVTSHTVLQMVGNSVGLTRYTEILDAVRATPEFRTAAGKTVADQQAAEQAHQYPLYDAAFTRLVDSLCRGVQQRIIALYTGGGSGGDGDAGPVDASTAAQMRDVLRMQERELTALREQVRVMRAAGGGEEALEAGSKAAQAAVVAQAEMKRWQERASKAEEEATAAEAQRVTLEAEVSSLQEKLQAASKAMKELQAAHVTETGDLLALCTQYQNSSAEADARADAAREEARQLQARLDASQQSGGDVGKGADVGKGGDAGAGADAGGGGGDTALAAKAEQLQAELADLRTQLAESQEARQAAQAELEQVRGELASVRGELASVRGELEQVRGELASVRGELASVRGDAQAAAAQHAAAVTAAGTAHGEAAAALEEEVAHLRNRLSAAEEMTEEAEAGESAAREEAAAAVARAEASDAAERAAAEALASAEAAERAAVKRAEAAEAETKAAEQRAEAAAAATRVAEQRAEAAEAAASAARAEAGGDRSQSDALVESLRQQLAAAHQHAQESASRKAADAAAEVAELRAALEAAMQARQQAEAAALSAQKQAAASAQQATALHSELQAASAAVTEAEGQVEAARHTASTHAAEAAAAKAAAAAATEQAEGAEGAKAQLEQALAEVAALRDRVATAEAAAAAAASESKHSADESGPRNVDAGNSEADDSSERATDACTQTLDGAGAATVSPEEDEDLAACVDDALEALGVLEFQKQTLVDALLRLGGAEEVETAQRKADQLIEAYCDQGFA